MERIKNIVYKVREEDSSVLYEFFLLSIAIDFIELERKQKIQNTWMTEKECNIFSEEEMI